MGRNCVARIWVVPTPFFHIVRRNRNKRHPTHKYTSRTRELKTPGGREKKADQNFLRYRYFSRKEKRERGGEVIDRRGRRGKKGKATSYFVHGYPIKSE